MLDTVNAFEGVADLDLYTCQDKLVCLLSPSGDACGVMKTTGRTNGYYSMSNDTTSLVYCNSTAGGAADPTSDACVPVDTDACTASSLYPGCYYTEVWGPDLLQNPIRVITPPTRSPSAAPSMSPTEAPISPAPTAGDDSKESEVPSQAPTGASPSVRPDCRTPLTVAAGAALTYLLMSMTRII
jgi:hypothetical protein